MSGVATQWQEIAQVLVMISRDKKVIMSQFHYVTVSRGMYIDIVFTPRHAMLLHLMEVVRLGCACNFFYKAHLFLFFSFLHNAISISQRPRYQQVWLTSEQK